MFNIQKPWRGKERKMGGCKVGIWEYTGMIFLVNMCLS